jgi:hypothetical protein
MENEKDSIIEEVTEVLERTPLPDFDRGRVIGKIEAMTEAPAAPAAEGDQA